jgi:hypothetical protein
VSAPTTRHPGRLPKLGERVPAFARTAIALNEHVARFGAERVAEVLSLRVPDLEPLLAGRVKPSKTAMQRLRALAGELKG